MVRLSEVGQSLETFDPTPATKCWFNEKNRCFTLSSHKHLGNCRRLQERTVVNIATPDMSNLENEEDDFEGLNIICL